MVITIASGNVNANLELQLAVVAIYSKIVEPAVYIMDTLGSITSVLIVNVCIWLVGDINN